MAYKACKLLPHQFYEITPRSFFNLLKVAGELADAEAKQQWELARYQAYYTLKPYLKPAEQKKPIADVIALPWDKPQALPQKSTKKEDALAFWERADKDKK